MTGTTQADNAELIWHQIKANPGMTVLEASKYLGKGAEAYMRNMYKSRALDRTAKRKDCENAAGYVTYYAYTAVGDKFPGYNVPVPTKKKRSKAVKGQVIVTRHQLAPTVGEDRQQLSQSSIRTNERVAHGNIRSPIVSSFLLALPSLQVNEVMTVKNAIANLFAA